MKIIVAAILVVAVLLGISPYFIGSKLESSSQDYLSQYQFPGYQYSLEVDRGFRSSVYSYGISMDPNFLASAYSLTQDEIDEITQLLEEIALNVYVQHGPMLTQNGIGLGLADMQLSVDAQDFPALADYFELIGVDRIFAADGRLGFSGSGQAEFEIPAIEFENLESGFQSSFAGLTGETAIEDFGQYFSTNGYSSGGSLSSAGIAEVALGAISFSSEIRMDEALPWFGVGQGEFLLDTFSVTALDQSGSIQDLAIAFAMADGATPDTTSIEYSFGFGALESDEISLADAEVLFAYENISKEAINNYMDLIMNLPLGDDQMMEAALMQFALAELPSALALDPAFSVPRLSFTHEDRTFEASFRMAIDGQKLPTAVSLLRSDLLVPAVTAELHLDADETLINDILVWQAATSVDASFAQNPELELTPEMRQTMIDQQASMSIGIAEAQGFLVRENGRIRTSLGLADRMLDINGTAMPLPF
jgi:uncharacterized protein YdgA (DUF945 family)